MRKLKLFLSMLMLIAFSVGNVWADPAAVGTTLFSENFGGYSADDVPSGSVSSSTGNRVIYGGSSVTYTSADNGTNKTKIYSANLAGGTSPELLVGKSGGVFTITGIPSGDAQEITVSFKQNAQKLTASLSGTGYSTEYTSPKPTAAGEVSFDITVDDGADATFSLIMTAGSSNVRVDDILVTVKTAGEGGAPAKTLTSIAVSGAPTKTSYYAGDEFNPAGLVVTGTYSDASTGPISSGITWAYDPSQELSLNQTSIGVTATVGEISSPKFNVTGLTVTEAPAAVNYEKVTAEPADWSGEYLLVYEADATNARVWKGADQANNYAVATISAGVIAAPEGAAVLTIAKVAESDPVVYTIMVGDKYIGQTSDANGIKIQATAINNSISYNGTDAAVDIVASSAHLRYNSASSSYFRYYKSSSYSSQKKIQLYKKVEGTVKPAAGLEYAAADQKKLTKLGETFTAPTLVNPNNVTVTYASNAESVAEVNLSTGAVTIKAAGVAVITASFAGNDDYKAGSASYTIGVTSHAGTEADPYVAADAKTVIDVKGTVENAYASGVVSKVVTTTLPADGYITFDFSADGATTGQQIQAFKCYGLNSAPFEAVSDVETGATVVITGTLKKYNSTYEFDQNCHLVSYEAPAVPKTHIANTKETAYTVAQAITYAADGVHYDLDDYVYVSGVVYDVKSFNTTNGTLDIYIKDANAENQFELYKCAGINDGSATTPFEALTDVQVGDEIIGYGQLTVYNTTYEFKQGNYLVDLNRPVVAVTSVELTESTANVEEGSTVTLHASVVPDNATNKGIVWSVESGDSYASVDNEGVVTGIAAGEAIIRATSDADATKYAECTVTVTAAPVLTDYYEKVTSTVNIVDGTYLIVYEEGGLAFDGGLATLDAVGNTIPVTIVGGNKIGVTNTTEAATFFIDVTAGTIKSASGNFIGVGSWSNGLKQDKEYAHNVLEIDGDGNAQIGIYNADWNTTGGTMRLQYNKSSGQTRFRYYKNGGQQPIALYKLANEVVKPAAGLAWDPADDIELTVGDAFTAPTLLNPNNIDAAEITIESSNTDVATVTAGVVALVADATGTTTITATFAGNASYKPATVSYNITVNAVAPTPTVDNVVILATYDSKYYAMSTNNVSSAFTAIAVEYDGSQVTVNSAEDKAAIQWTRSTSGENTTFQDADDKYMKSADGTAMSLQDAVCNWVWDENGYYKIPETARTFFYQNGTGFKNFATSNFNKTGYSDKAQVIVIDPANIVITSKVSAELAYDPASDEITQGDAWSAPVLGYVSGFDGLAAITYASDNEAVAEVTDAGVISLAGGTGTATITATFAGNANYLAGSATYTITVNAPAPTPTGTTYRKVTATSDITDGEYLIVYEDENVAFNGNLTTLDAAHNTVDVVISGDVIVGSTEIDAAVFTIDVANGTLRAHMGDYIGVTSYGNGLKQNANAETYPAHSFSIDGEGNAIISLDNSWTAAMILNYNKGVSDKRFRYYKSASPQQSIQLYKKETVTPSYTDVRTGLTAGKYYTICHNKQMTAIKGATLWEFESKDASFAYIVKANAPYVAGRPYIIYAESEKLEAVEEGSEVSAPNNTETNGLYGTFEQLEQSNFDAIATAKSADVYFIYNTDGENSELRKVNGQTGNWIRANRAYVIVAEIPDGTPAPMPGRQIRSMSLPKNTPTGMDQITNDQLQMSNKVIINGHLYIIRGEKMYDATGRLVK